MTEVFLTKGNLLLKHKCWNVTVHVSKQVIKINVDIKVYRSNQSEAMFKTVYEKKT